MKERLNRITTRSGDDGSTGLANGQRLPKSHARIQAMGDVDELNSQIGLLLAEALPQPQRDLLMRIQHELFDLGADLALPEQTSLSDGAVLNLEAQLQALNAQLPALQEFILPAGTRAGALTHVCRCVARRAERSIVALSSQEPAATPTRLLHYLNRLSDLLFVLARQLNRDASGATNNEVSNEVYWRSAKLRAQDKKD